MGLTSALGACLLALGCLQPGAAHREHKVHNIVLYPDKESWCKTTPIKQVVTWASCLPQELDNNVCVGACFSYMVPHSEPSAPGDLIRPYCDSCQPLDSIWHTVSLQCRDKEGKPTHMQKKVQIITNCSCSSCAESERIKPDLNSLLQSLELREDAAAAPPAAEAAPDEATLAPASVAPSPLEPAAGAAEPPADAPPQHHELPDLLLDSNLGQAARRNASRAEPAERLLHFFKQLNDPDWPAADKLAKLGSLDHLDKLDKLASEEAGAKELLAKLSELLHKYRQSQAGAAEAATGEAGGSAPSSPAAASLLPPEPPKDEEAEAEGADPEEQPEPPAAPPAPAGLLPPELPKDEDDEEVPSLQDQQLRVAASLLHRTGPHHSLVLDAGVKEKIDVDSHYLHPALAGQEISYHDNLLLDKAKKKDF